MIDKDRILHLALRLRILRGELGSLDIEEAKAQLAEIADALEAEAGSDGDTLQPEKAAPEGMVDSTMDFGVAPI